MSRKLTSIALIMLSSVVQAGDTSFSQWSPQPSEFTGGKVDGEKLSLSSGLFRAAEPQPWKWVGWFTSAPARDLELQASVTITRPAIDFHWFGQSWSVWPDPFYGDGGFEAGFAVAADPKSNAGYRVQWSHKHQCVALVRYPQGGYVRVAPCPIDKEKPLTVRVSRQGRDLRVMVEGKELIHYRDPLPLLPAGQVGLMTSSRGAVTFANVKLKALPEVAEKDQPVRLPTQHKPNFSVRKWLGERPWVFDGDEPILLLPVQYKQNDTYYVQIINNVKLRPGFKPMLMWNAHWDIAGQGAWKDGGSKSTEPQTKGGGASLQATWQAKHHANRFQTQTRLTIGFDSQRGSYTYDMDSQLEILPGPPFRIDAFELEHHTPLDPFNWKYLVIRKSKDELLHRPLYPIDPGPLYNIEGKNGLRMWYGRHNEPLTIAPTVKYFIEPSQRPSPHDPKRLVPREISTAVCAAFYDTGIAYGAEELPAGTVIRSRYRYTGYPADEAERIFKTSKRIPSPRLDPNHHYVWADAWPRLTFAKAKAMSEPWWDATMPFMSAHNARPTYKWAKNTGSGSGFALQLPPRSFGQSDIPLAKPLPAGRYVMRGLCKAEGVVGPGGRLELTAFAKDNRKLVEYTHYLGAGEFDWRPYAFAFRLSSETARLNVTFGNAGTGDMFIGESRFEELAADAPLPADVAAEPNRRPAKYAASPKGAIFDVRLTEGKGHYAFNYAGEAIPPLELCNMTWEKQDGRAGLRFRLPAKGSVADFARGGGLEFFYFTIDEYKKNGPSQAFALAGSHGSPQRDYTAITLATWIRPDATMIKNQQMADLLGFGSRRIRLRLLGEKAPYQLGVQFTEQGEGDKLQWTGEPFYVSADKWHHVALTAAVNSEKHWEIKLYLDGQLVRQAVDKKAPVPLRAHDSVVLGTELHYLHCNYYQGLMGRTLILDRALSAAEIAELRKLP
ncbi:MAG: LamG domain-containing protein [Gemmataceae bacterium]